MKANLTKLVVGDRFQPIAYPVYTVLSIAKDEVTVSVNGARETLSKETLNRLGFTI